MMISLPTSVSTQVNNRKMNKGSEHGYRLEESVHTKMNDIRLRSRMMDVEAASVRLELTASQVRLDMRSLLLRRVITSSLRTIPCGVTVQESSMLTPSLIQRKKGRGLPVDIMTSQETETEYKSQNTMTCREPEMKQKVSRFPVWTLLFHNRTA